MEEVFREFAADIALVVEVVAVLVVAFGALEALVALVGGLEKDLEKAGERTALAEARELPAC